MFHCWLFGTDNSLSVEKEPGVRSKAPGKKCSVSTDVDGGVEADGPDICRPRVSSSRQIHTSALPVDIVCPF